MPGKAWRQNLADRRSKLCTAEDADKRVAVDRVVQRLAHPHVVERRQVDVERRIPNRSQRVHVHLIGVLGADLREAVGRRLVKHPVGLTVLDRGDRRFLGQTELVGDLVGESHLAERRRSIL